jgi:hypothetical protein
VIAPARPVFRDRLCQLPGETSTSDRQAENDEGEPVNRGALEDAEQGRSPERRGGEQVEQRFIAVSSERFAPRQVGTGLPHATVGSP